MGKLTVSVRTKAQLYVWLYLASFTVLLSWVLLLLVGFVNAGAMALATRVGLPVIVGSVICLTLFKCLAGRADRRLG